MKLRTCYRCKSPTKNFTYTDYHHLFPNVIYKHTWNTCTNKKCNTSTISGKEMGLYEKLVSLTHLHSLIPTSLNEMQFRYIRSIMGVSKDDLEASLKLQKIKKLKPAPPHDSENCEECKYEHEQEKKMGAIS